jgi:plasmid stabilization system protein ParE
MYRVKLTDEAKNDLDRYIHHIHSVYHAPLTALKHYIGLSNTINILKHAPDSYPIQTRTSLQQFGANVRRINFKKMAIIFTIHDDVVYIHRIIAGAMITGL